MTDEILKKIKDAYNSLTTESGFHQIVVENISILEREGDEKRRKVAEDFFKLLVKEVHNSERELVKTPTGYGIVFKFGKIIGEPLSFFFYKFETLFNALGYWDSGSKMIYINAIDYKQFLEDLKSDNFKNLFISHQTAIFHELIHFFDHKRYRLEFQPDKFDSIINNAPEFEAYYQTYARSIQKIVSSCNSLEDFYKRFGTNPSLLIKEFWDTSPKEMEKRIKDSKLWSNKWNKRLYQLYYEMYDKFNKTLKESFSGLTTA